MAKKAELLEQARKLKLDVSAKNTIAQIEEALNQASQTSVKANENPEIENDAKEAVVAKAGKRSAKALKEAGEKAEKEERKTSGEEPTAKAKPVIKIRSKIERKGKKYRSAVALIDKSKQFSTKEAVDLAVKTSTAKFDATAELHIKLGVDPRHADQNIRATLVLPEGTGKTVKVAVFAEADDLAKAKTAGADITGNEEFLQQLDKGVIDFDVLIATPAVMPKLGKYARMLGPKGLMPSPKSGSVTTDVTKAVKEAKAGKVEYRVDSNGIVHIGFGKVSFGPERLVKNLNTLITSIKSAKPASAKGVYIQSVYVSTTMGPSVKIDPSSL